MSTEGNANVACGEQLQREFQHLKADWCWLLLYGILLVVCGTAAIVFPMVASFAVTIVLGITLIVAGIATVVASFWAGKWSGLLVQLLVGILYIMVGLAFADTPVRSTITLTLFIAAFFIVAGAFRMVSSLVIRFPYWGWSLLNGMITFMLGVIIYRQFPQSAIWVIGLLVGIEMLFHGWTWIMLSLAIRRIPEKAA